MHAQLMYLISLIYIYTWCTSRELRTVLNDLVDCTRGEEEDAGGGGGRVSGDEIYEGGGEVNAGL